MKPLWIECASNPDWGNQHNIPMNMNNVLYFYCNDYPSKTPDTLDDYQIAFKFDGDTKYWHFLDALTRDNTYKEILQYIEAKKF